jgi:hypothetical protein
MPETDAGSLVGCFAVIAFLASHASGGQMLTILRSICSPNSSSPIYMALDFLQHVGDAAERWRFAENHLLHFSVILLQLRQTSVRQHESKPVVAQILGADLAKQFAHGVGVQDGGVGCERDNHP